MPTTPLSSSPFITDLARIVDESGHAVVAVGYGACSEPGCRGCREDQPWSYSVGLHANDMAELVVMGADPDRTRCAINWVASRRSLGVSVPLDQPFELDGTTMKLVAVPDEWLLTDPDRMGCWFALRAGWSGATGLPMVEQVVFADLNGRFPDESGCDPRVSIQQPILRDDPFSQPHRTIRRATRPAKRHRR